MSATTPTELLDQVSLDELSINTIRLLAADGVQRARSGHPGMPMGSAPMAYVLWTQFLKHNPSNPAWEDRDRFILSAGHGSMLLYSLLHLCGYDLPLDELMRFRQLGSRTPGHPERDVEQGIEMTTGPLGQGFATGVGMAIAERHLAARFNRPGFPIVDHFTYAIVSDGDLMEGISHEAASLAGHLGLGKLIYLYDDNGISIDGSTSLSFTEDVGNRFAAYNWHVQHVEDGNDLRAIGDAIQAAREETGRPSIICVRTIIGFGSPSRQGSSKVHGEPLGEEELARTRVNLGMPDGQAFYVPEPVYRHTRGLLEGRTAEEKQWRDLFARYEIIFPDLAEEYRAAMQGALPPGWDSDLPAYRSGEKEATRNVSGAVLNAVGPRLPWLVGGSADLTPSTKTDVKGRADFQRESPEGTHFRFGVREHAMAAACNGMAIHGGMRPYCGTFFVFSDYLRPAMRLGAIMGAPVIYVFTHDSIGVGEDGPTHQPIEQLMSLRAMPNLVVIRPADAQETIDAWRLALTRRSHPTALLLTRQSIPVLDRAGVPAGQGLERGAYVLSDSPGVPELILLGTGSEVQHCIAAAETLRAEGRRVRVVSMPSWELFEEQEADYREALLPGSVKRRLAVEAGVTLGWERYVGVEGAVIGIDRFGISAPFGTVMERFGLTASQVAERARALF